MGGTMISQLEAGQTVTDFFILRSKEKRTKKGSSEFYLSVELGDCSGRIFGSLWKNINDVDALLKPGVVVKVRGKVIDWHGRPHLSIDKLRLATEGDNISPDAFLPRSKTALKTLLESFRSQADQVQEPFLKMILTRVLENSEWRQKLKKAPAGKLWHHCYVGGLLEHTLNVTRLVRTIAENYEHINRDLLVTGALLHDIGKIYEYDANGFIDYTDAGRLHGHIAIGYHVVASIVDSIPEFPQHLRNELLHLILSHQGAKEHGSPAVPMSREALILNAADDLDAKLGAFERIFEREHEPDKPWSNYVNLLDRFLYFGNGN